MKRFKEGTHQISDDLTVENAMFSCLTFFYKITAHCDAKHVHYLLGVGNKVGQ